MDLSDKNHLDNQQYAYTLAFRIILNGYWLISNHSVNNLKLFVMKFISLLNSYFHLKWKIDKAPLFSNWENLDNHKFKMFDLTSHTWFMLRHFYTTRKNMKCWKNLVVLYILDFFTLSLCDQMWNAAYQYLFKPTRLQDLILRSTIATNTYVSTWVAFLCITNVFLRIMLLNK